MNDARHDEIAEGVEDDVDGDALARFADERLLELLADGVALPDERLEEDRLGGAVDGFEHGVVEVAPVAVDTQGVLADVELGLIEVGEALGWAAARALLGDRQQNGGGDHLHADGDGEGPPEEAHGREAAPAVR